MENGWENSQTQFLFTMKRTDWRIFLYRSVIGVGRDHRSWMRNLQRRVLDRYTGSEEKRNKYKLADSGDNFRDPDARARSELSQAKSAIAMGYTFNDDDGAIGGGGGQGGP